MKSNLTTLVITLIIFCNYHLSAQTTLSSDTNYDVITINFKDLSSFKAIDILKKDKTYVFELINVNRHIYKVESSLSQTDFNSTVPSVFKGIKFPSYLNLSLPDASSDIKGALNSQYNGQNLKSDLDKILAKIDALNISLINIINYDNQLSSIIENCEKEYDDLQSELETTTYTLTGKSTYGPAQTNALLKMINKLILDAKTSESELNRANLLYSDLISSNMERVRFDIEDWVSKKMKPEANNPMYVDGLDSYKNNRLKLVSYGVYNEDLKLKIASAKAALVEIKKIESENKGRLLVNKYNLINKANFTYTTDPIKIKSDEVKLEITAKTEKPLSCNIQNEIKISRTFKVVGGTRIDFSTGAFFNSGNDDFLGRDLYYSSIDETQSVIKTKDGGSRGLLSIGGLMHIYKRSNKNMHLAFSPGVSVSSGFDQLNFHLGASVLFGNKNRLVITGGLTLRETKILDKNFVLDTAYTTTVLPETPPLISVFPKAGFFFSLTYNFSKFESASE